MDFRYVNHVLFVPVRKISRYAAERSALDGVLGLWNDFQWIYRGDWSRVEQTRTRGINTDYTSNTGNYC